MRRAALLIAASMLVGGCTTVVAGTPAVAPAPALPPRPRELRLDGIDPCSLLTPAQRTTLGLDQQSRAFTAVPPAPGPACAMVGFRPRAVGTSIVLAVSTGITELTRPGATTDELTPTTVHGYASFVARARNPDVCFVDVDVAEDQVLDVVFSDGGGIPPVSQVDLCKGAVNVADQVVSTLLKR